MEEKEFNVVTKTKIGIVQLKNTENIIPPENTKITKVLTVTANAQVDNFEVTNSCLKLIGTVEYDLLVVLDDNSIIPITQKSDFLQNFESKDIKSDSSIDIIQNVLEINDVSSNGMIVYSSIINFDILSIDKNENNVFAIKPSDDVFVSESEINFDILKNSIKYDSKITFDVQKDSKTNKILYVINSASIKSIVPSNDYFIVSGNSYSTIVFESEEGLIRSQIKENSFSEEVESIGTTKESNIQASIMTKETIIVENTEKNVFEIEVPINIKAQIYNKFAKKCIVDAYSLKNEINLTTTSFKKDKFLNIRQFQDNFLTTSLIEQKLQPIDRVLAVIPNNICLVNQIVGESSLLTEGISKINIIYYSLDEEGDNVLNSIDIEVPFSLKFKVDDLDENDEVFSNLALGDISVKNKLGKELEILAEIKVNCNIVKKEITAIVSDLAIGEEKPYKDYALEIYLANGTQTLWDIAKELNMSIEELTKQNGEISLPIKSGEKIIAYRQKRVDFN